ncbi:hypothetical protein [Hoeflea olei]|uniref:Uncharacterized protein n=1 Tax=Hoeflea olei TaxID=1480615 RepID=A0A1C1YZZ0_9HYPH|nr:hypothetical protein [Hoeflea olei]OCW58980.1 hypothetical protein AWJ14_04510 [Hoeflea olei]
MWLPAENLCGLIGSGLLLFAPARDQLLRQLNWKAARRAQKGGATRKYWDIISSGYETERNAWSFWDSATMAAGALLIGASYVINPGG